MLVLIVFLRSLSSTIIIGLSIPIAVISTFTLMYFYGFTLNTISFGGLALGVGMLVDNAIVVLENIFRHRQEGQGRIAAALTGSKEVAGAITASTLTTVAVFLPLVFVSGLSAVTFKQLAYVVSFSLLCSLVVALTLIPVMSSRYLRGKAEQTNGWQERMAEKYGALLGWALRHRKTTLAGAATAFGLCLLMMPLVGVELSPEADEGEVRVDVQLEPGVRVHTTDAIMQRLARIVERDVPEASSIMVESGSGGGWSAGGEHIGELRIQLKPRSERERTAKERGDGDPAEDEYRAGHVRTDARERRDVRAHDGVGRGRPRRGGDSRARLAGARSNGDEGARRDGVDTGSARSAGEPAAGNAGDAAERRPVEGGRRWG